MAATTIHAREAIPEHSELAQELASVLSPEHELFASSVASGMSYRESAKAAGFSENHGFRIMQMPPVGARIEELLSEPAERIRAGIDAEFLMLRNRAANEDLDAEGRANVELRLKLVMAHARYHGWIVDKKQVSRASVSFRAAIGDRAQFEALVQESLASLPPGARARLKRIAAGELDSADRYPAG